ncbi:ADP-ribosylation factor-binding protein GGA1-like [Erpetoichthys calabaricus]|uniref:Golgi associated, gamma adaptin ear containing, ARF binding protein 2 n=1 Tax=Erpetoichthys calabaricus TaxID=27687 RepID=A0A8C4SL91_ERPCA|nr:ADP-ribosylation factor-binding protein GGA1-like [Erpetoichthys calabaricus]
MELQDLAATGAMGNALESWLNKATDPTNDDENWESIKGFYEEINKQPDGPQVALRLLAHKIQSPQEKESLQALTVLEACMNNCGKRFHNEATKFRFLNELIKVLSPKYLGTWSTDNVKSKIIEILYSWTMWLPEEVKLHEAYSMLKKQGIIKKDPKLSQSIIVPPPPPRTTCSIFDDDDKSKLLARLLKSNHPDDLQAANRLIKSTIKEDQEKKEKVAKRIAVVEEVENNCKLLNEMLISYKKCNISESDRQIIKGLYDRCEKLRPTLFRLASDTVDDDQALAEILQANDKLTVAINTYQEVVGREELNGNNLNDNSKTKDPPSPCGIKSYHLIDLSSVESTFSNTTGQTASNPYSTTEEHVTSASFLDEDLMSLGLNDPLALPPLQRIPGSESFDLDLNIEQKKLTAGSGSCIRLDPFETSRTSLLHCSEISFTQQNKSPLLQSRSCYTLDHSLLSSSSQKQAGTSSCALSTDIVLSDIFVSLDSVKPSNIQPITAYDKNGFRVMLHLAKDPPPGRPDVLVIVISMLSTSPFPVKNILFQAAVPKAMTIKLLPASGSELPGFNPVLPPSVISQIMLLANPKKEIIRLRYKLNFTQGSTVFSELGEVDQFPEMSSQANI